MDPEELRLQIVNGCDKILKLPNWVVAAGQKRVVAAERAFWMLPDAPLAKLITLLPEPKGSFHEAPDCLSWLAGMFNAVGR